MRRANQLLNVLAKAGWKSEPSRKDIQQAFTTEYGYAIFQQHFAKFIPLVHRIPEFRQIRDGEPYSFDGTGLVSLLASLKSPDVGKDEDKAKFARIQALVQRLLHLPGAMLDVPPEDPTKIIVEHDGLRLPMVGSYGTGVHELVILVTAITSQENVLWCIEEPEIHFHPTLQQEFLEYATTETENQYLISTHSPTLINAHGSMPTDVSSEIQVFHLRLQNNTTVGSPIAKDEQSLVALADLGVKASDILQTNGVVWVEGPSDRIYLRRWIEVVAPELAEGVDYSIVLYGGKDNLGHLSAVRDKVSDSAEDEGSDGPLDILRINQNAIVVIDSDRQQSGEELSAEKQRILEECEVSGVLCWVTDGREIENYVSEDVINTALEERGQSPVELSIEFFANFTKMLGEALEKAGAQQFPYTNKVMRARLFAPHFEKGNMGTELIGRLETVVEKVKSWNE